MTTPRFFTGLVLLAVYLAACSPATATVAPAQPVTVIPTATLLPTATLDAAPQVTMSPMEAPAPTLLPIATSRGPNLEATDPTTVSIASGGLQFVEFFEFW
jgi:hypothetical protein